MPPFGTTDSVDVLFVWLVADKPVAEDAGPGSEGDVGEPAQPMREKMGAKRTTETRITIA